MTIRQLIKKQDLSSSENILALLLAGQRISTRGRADGKRIANYIYLLKTRKGIPIQSVKYREEEGKGSWAEYWLD